MVGFLGMRFRRNLAGLIKFKYYHCITVVKVKTMRGEYAKRIPKDIVSLDLTRASIRESWNDLKAGRLVSFVLGTADRLPENWMTRIKRVGHDVKMTIKG